MKGFILKTPGKRAATPGRLRGGRIPRLEYDCPPTPRQARDAAADRAFANTGVRTVLAIKPLEVETGATMAEFPVLSYDSTAKALITTAPPDQAPGDSCPEHSFDSRYFDQVYQGNTIRADLKKELQPIVDGVVEGRSAAVVAYGQTGSGKTFLMEGEPSMQDRGAWGLAPYAVYRVLQAVQKSTGKKFLVSLSFLEIYNETVRDLLDPRPLKKGEQSPSLQLRLNPDGYYDVPEATSTPVSDTAQALALIQAGSARRARAATAMNARSSRSFADVILTVESIEEATGAVCSCRLHLVDLAGSERQAQTLAEGARLKESSSINLALLALRKVVHARSASQPTPAPYTDSKVTKVLKDALSGDSALLIVCCLSASPVNYQDSLGTLKFAASCRSLTAKPTVRRVSNTQSRITGLSVAVERVRAAEQAALAEQMIRLESRAVAKDLALQVAEAQLLEARDQLQAGANLALAAQAACEELLLRCADAIDELVTSQADRSGLLARHMLPQLDFCLSTPQMTAHVEPRALLRFFKSLLQVNFAASHSAAIPLASVFHRLLAFERPKDSADLLVKAWPGLLTYCGKLLLAESEAQKLPPFVLDNFQKALNGILKLLGSEEVKRVVGSEGNRPEVREALEVAGRVSEALKDGCFSGVLKDILRKTLPFQREALVDLESPLGSDKADSPSSWLTPSRARGKSSRSAQERCAERLELERDDERSIAVKTHRAAIEQENGSRTLNLPKEDSERSTDSREIQQKVAEESAKSPEDCFSLEELGEEVERSPGSWLTPRAIRNEVGPSRLSSVRSPVVNTEQKVETSRLGHNRSGSQDDQKGKVSEESRSAFAVAQYRKRKEDESGKADLIEDENSRQIEVKSEAATQKCPRALITGEWHTPEYMKAKETVSRKVKTCERGGLGLRTPEEKSVSESMESVKKVLFAEGSSKAAPDRAGNESLSKVESVENGSKELRHIKGNSGAADQAETEASSRVERFKNGSEEKERVEKLPLWKGQVGKEALAKVERFQNGSDEKQRTEKLPLWKDRHSLTGRQVLSPLKIGAANGALPPVTRTPTFFGARLVGKENAPATDLPKLPRRFDNLTTSAYKPPRAVLDTCLQDKGAAPTGNTSGAEIAQLRSHLSMLMSHDTKQPDADSQKVERVGKVDTSTNLTTPSRLPKKGAATYLSPALLWTPSRGPSPSLDNLRERLAGMSRK